MKKKLEAYEKVYAEKMKWKKERERLLETVQVKAIKIIMIVGNFCEMMTKSPR